MRGLARSRSPASASTLSYAEDHCALRWPLLASGLYAPACILALAVAQLIVAKGWFYWTLFALFMLAIAGWVGFGGGWLMYMWPTGIRLDTAGVRVGGVRWSDKHPGRTRSRKAIVPRQYSQVFACKWGGVLRIGVTTDPAVLKTMKRHACRGRKLTPLGNLATPYMRAALVIWVDRDHAQQPNIRAARSPFWTNYAAPGYHQPIWVVPTRRAARLESALAAIALPAGTVSDPGTYIAADTAVPEWSPF